MQVRFWSALLLVRGFQGAYNEQLIKIRNDTDHLEVGPEFRSYLNLLSVGDMEHNAPATVAAFAVFVRLPCIDKRV